MTLFIFIYVTIYSPVCEVIKTKKNTVKRALTFRHFKNEKEPEQVSSCSDLWDCYRGQKKRVEKLSCPQYLCHKSLRYDSLRRTQYKVPGQDSTPDPFIRNLAHQQSVNCSKLSIEANVIQISAPYLTLITLGRFRLLK